MNSTEIKVEVAEHDESGNLIATYVQTKSGPSEAARVDIILPERQKKPWQSLVDVFLPAGYPHSVTEDYLEYQIYVRGGSDSLQAFSSSIAGLLASRAVLEGVGVGDATASPTAALLLSILQESMGRIATILFAHKLGTSLEPECKMYRLAADIFNDAAMVLDCLSPAFPKMARVVVLSFSSVLRALCGVAAGSSKASLSAHFARWGNLGELNAKDSSQETIISLMGMLAGSVVVSWVSSPTATWSTLILLLAIHLGTNRAAVRAVKMRTLNRQRANIVISHLFEKGEVLTPHQVSQRERIFERDGVLRWTDDAVIGRCQIGVRLETLLWVIRRTVAQEDRHQGARGSAKPHGIKDVELSRLLDLFSPERYIMWFDDMSGSASRHPSLPTGYIVLKEGVKPEDQLKAWFQALLLAQQARERKSAEAREIDAPGAHGAGGAPVSSGGRRNTNDYHEAFGKLSDSLDLLGQVFEEYVQKLKAAGWDLDNAALETRSGTRADRGASASGRGGT